MALTSGPSALATELLHENTDLKKRLKESEDLRKNLVIEAAERVLFQLSMQDRLEMYEETIQTARTLRDPETGTVDIENMLSFFDALDRIPVPS